ncbi:MAG: cell wall-active antibiotics response protein [candidate division Zixibacteria bacterium]|nr:cell wall-active antibiotics response protein [candidate division Zixibacteria bacterium]
MRIYSCRIIWGFILIIIGGLYLLDSLHIIDFSLWNSIGKLWPLLLIVIGLYIIFSKSKRTISNCPVDTSTASRFVGDINVKVPAKNLSNSNISNFIGDINVTVDDTDLPEGEGKAILSSFIGDASLIIPNGLPFHVEHSSLIGDLKVNDSKVSNTIEGGFKSDNYDQSSNKVYIRFNAFIGDFKVIVK